MSAGVPLSCKRRGAAGDRSPRYGEHRDRGGLSYRDLGGGKPPFTVGRGPVPRQRPRNPTIAGDRPPRYGKKTSPFPIGRWENLSLASTRAIQRSRGTGPRATGKIKTYHSVGQDRLILTRSGAGAPELQRWARCLPVFALQGGINTETEL